MELINDLLELSRIEAGSVEITPSPVDPVALGYSAMDLLRVQASQKGLLLDLQCGDQEQPWLCADSLRVRQVLVNLLSNAIKFTEYGAVTMAIESTQEDGDVLVSYRVTDTGIGMSTEQVERIFEPYAQADRKTVARFGGTGLGLSISRELAQLMGGDLRVSSSEGLGSTFCLQVRGPRTEPDLPTAQPQSRAGAAMLTGTRLLLAEDQPDLARVVRIQLERVGCEVVHAQDGREALDLFLGQAWDIILLDIQMPKLTGFEVAREIRSSGWSGPLVALSANALTEHDTHLQGGFDDFAIKPLPAEALRRLVHDHVTRRAAG